MPTVLTVGSSGNIGVSAVIAALKAKFDVLAIVRNQASAENLFKHVGTREGITIVEADVTTPEGVQGVVDKVRAGELPAFQHVYSCVGAWSPQPLHEISIDDFHRALEDNFGSNFCISQAAMFAMLKIASREMSNTNVRINEAYLNAQIEYDDEAEKTGSIPASSYARIYEEILTKPEIRGNRIIVEGRQDLEKRRMEKLPQYGQLKGTVFEFLEA